MRSDDCPLLIKIQDGCNNFKLNGMKKLNVFLILILLVSYSCNDNVFFEKEQYKTVFALVSDDGYNIFDAEHTLNQPESDGYIAASCGGTLPSEKDITAKISLDKESFDQYNYLNFDVDRANYAKLLPASKYEIEDYSLTIPAGERSGRMKIKIRPDGLSPDSTYFIPVKVDSYSSYEVNPEKSNVLYRVLIKNNYATQKPATNYTMRAFRGTVQLPGIKTMHPISRNKVRILVDNTPFQPDLAIINKYGLILEILEDKSINISSYKDVKVTQVDGDPDFPNIFFIEKTAYKNYKVFLLRYNYINDSGQTVEMKEELRMEYSDLEDDLE